MFCHICGNKVAEGAGFCHKCGSKLMADATTQQSPDNNINSVSIKSVVSLGPYIKSLSITRLIIAIVWAIITILQWGLVAFSAMDLIDALWNTVSTTIQLFIAITLLGVGFVRLSELELKYDSIEDYSRKCTGCIERNEGFASLAILWYGYQVFWQRNTIMIIFLIIEVIILIVSLITMRMMRKELT